MPLPTHSGDILLTRQQTVVFGLNAAGRVEVTPLFSALQDRYPAFVSEFHKRGRAGRLVPGTFWLWRDSRPWLLALLVRETPTGATRLRHVEAALLALLTTGRQEGVRSLAVLRLAEGPEWSEMRIMLERRLEQLGVPARLYEEFRAGEQADEGAAAPHDDAPGSGPDRRPDV